MDFEKINDMSLAIRSITDSNNQLGYKLSALNDSLSQTNKLLTIIALIMAINLIINIYNQWKSK